MRKLWVSKPQEAVANGTQCCLKQQQALLGKHKQSLTLTASLTVSEKFQVLKD